MGSLRSGYTCDTGRSGITFGSLRSGCSGRTRWSLCAGQTNRALGSLRSGRTCDTGRTGISFGTLGSGFSVSTISSGRANQRHSCKRPYASGFGAVNFVGRCVNVKIAVNPGCIGRSTETVQDGFAVNAVYTVSAGDPLRTGCACGPGRALHSGCTGQTNGTLRAGCTCGPGRALRSGCTGQTNGTLRTGCACGPGRSLCSGITFGSLGTGFTVQGQTLYPQTQRHVRNQLQQYAVIQHPVMVLNQYPADINFFRAAVITCLKQAGRSRGYSTDDKFVPFPEHSGKPVHPVKQNIYAVQTFVYIHHRHVQFSGFRIIGCRAVFRQTDNLQTDLFAAVLRQLQQHTIIQHTVRSAYPHFRQIQHSVGCGITGVTQHPFIVWCCVLQHEFAAGYGHARKPAFLERYRIRCAIMIDFHRRN